MLSLLVPVKPLAEGKGRLASLLNDSARLSLNVWLLRNILRIASEFPGPRYTAVVSSCPEVLHIAKSQGMMAIDQDGVAGLNAASEYGVRRLRDRGADEILILPVDLPMIEASEIREIYDLSEPRRIVICPDRRRTGTNALLLGKEASLDFQFGQESCERHRKGAIGAGFCPVIHWNSRIAADLDVAEDLLSWSREYRRLGGPETNGLFRCLLKICEDLKLPG